MKALRQPIKTLSLIFTIGAIIFLIAANPAYPQCDCGPCPPKNCVKLTTTKDIYKHGEEVNFVFLNPVGCGLEFERLYILRQPFSLSLDDVVYIHQFKETAQPDTLWTWTWDQREDCPDLVTPGRYLLVIETKCCGTFKTSFCITCMPVKPKEEAQEIIKTDEGLPETKPAPEAVKESAKEKEAAPAETVEEKVVEEVEEEGINILCIIAGLIAVAAAMYI